MIIIIIKLNCFVKFNAILSLLIYQFRFSQPKLFKINEIENENRNVNQANDILNSVSEMKREKYII